MAAGVVAALLLGALLAARSAGVPDPARQQQRSAYAAAAAATADDALAQLEGRLQDARGSARAGAALILEGDEPPGRHLVEAAEQLEAAADEATAAQREARRAGGVLRSAFPDMAPVPPQPLPTPAELAGIAVQLRDAAEAAGTFVEVRHATDETLRNLEAALTALDDGAPRDALAALERAEAARQRVAAWERPPVTLPRWLDTTDRLISAAALIAEATLAGDPAAAREAGEAYAAAAQEARRADLALAISLAESGAGLAEVPMRRLADALAAVAGARESVAPVLQTEA